MSKHSQTDSWNLSSGRQWTSTGDPCMGRKRRNGHQWDKGNTRGHIYIKGFFRKKILPVCLMLGLWVLCALLLWKAGQCFNALSLTSRASELWVHQKVMTWLWSSLSQLQSSDLKKSQACSHPWSLPCDVLLSNVKWMDGFQPSSQYLTKYSPILGIIW